MNFLENCRGGPISYLLHISRVIDGIHQENDRLGEWCIPLEWCLGWLGLIYVVHENVSYPLNSLISWWDLEEMFRIVNQEVCG